MEEGKEDRESMASEEWGIKEKGNVVWYCTVQNIEQAKTERVTGS